MFKKDYCGFKSLDELKQGYKIALDKLTALESELTYLQNSKKHMEQTVDALKEENESIVNILSKNNDTTHIKRNGKLYKINSFTLVEGFDSAPHITCIGQEVPISKGLNGTIKDTSKAINDVFYGNYDEK